MIEADASIDILRPADAVFALMCDLPRAADWLQGCVALSVAEPGRLEQGARLHYVHRQAGHEFAMTGVVAEWKPGRLLRMAFSDPMFGVTVSLQCDPIPEGTRVTHVVSIDVRSFALRLMAPTIRVGNQQQVAGNLARLKRLAEASG